MDYGTEGEIMPHYEFDGLKQNIARMEQELADMKRQLEEQKKKKKRKWEMKPASWFINQVEDYVQELPHEYIASGQKIGLKRHTKELAELSAKRMKQANLLEYWAMVIDPEWRDEGVGTKAWYIFHTSGGIYTVDWHNSARHLGQVYMSEKAAREICEALNDGELVL